MIAVIFAAAMLMLSCPAILAVEQTVPATISKQSDAEVQKDIAEAKKLDAETASLKITPWIGLAQNTVGFLAILIPVLLGVQQLRAQRTALEERAKVDASLKAAEIAMNAPTTGQVRSRAQVLSVLLKDFVPDFGAQLDTLDFEKIGFASYRVRFLSLLEAIASHPEKALLLAETYQTLFPGDDENSRGRITELIMSLKGKS
jgi:hypothetical protein